MNKKKLLKKIKYGLRFLPDKMYLQIYYFAQFKKFINFKNPKTFNEKLNWLKLNDKNPKYTKMVDKYEAKKYAASIIGEEYIIPTLGVWDKFDDINFDKLPNQFVLKCTHDSEGLVIVRDKSKFNKEEAKNKIENAMKYNFFYIGREYPYKNVKPRIIAEEYMEDSVLKELRDYKFFCFNGEVKFFKIDFDRFITHKANYYDKNGKLLLFGEKICPPNFKKKLEMPINLKKMITFAEIFSKNNRFVRVDFYEINGKIYFGELTFYPASGFGKFIPYTWDKKIGDYLTIEK